MSTLLDGKRVLIIGGGGGGNGRAITRRVGAEGARAVGVIDIDLERAREAAAELHPTHAAGFAADVLSTAELEAAIDAAVAELGGLDVLITVVGGSGMFVPWQPLDVTTDEQWQLILDVNLTYVFKAVRVVLRTFLAQGTGGTVVSVGSLAGTGGIPMGGPYGAAKAGLINLAATVSAEYGRRGIRMNVVNCGLIMTPAATASLTDEITSTIPLGRPGTPDEVADAIVFLASPASAYVSGQSLNLDGAATARFPLALPNTDRSMAG